MFGQGRREREREKEMEIHSTQTYFITYSAHSPGKGMDPQTSNLIPCNVPQRDKLVPQLCLLFIRVASQCLPPADVILAYLACPLNDVIICLQLGITNPYL